MKKLHLPGTVTGLTVKNQTGISEFVIPGYSGIVTLNLENAGLLDTLALDILRQMAPQSRVRLLGLDLTFTEEEIERRVAQAITEGADMLDVGGYSSRPNADEVSVEEE